MRRKRSRKARQQPVHGNQLQSSSEPPSPDRSIRSLRSVSTSATTTSIPDLDDTQVRFLTEPTRAHGQGSSINNDIVAVPSSTSEQPLTSSSKTPKISNVTGATAAAEESEQPATPANVATRTRGERQQQPRNQKKNHIAESLGKSIEALKKIVSRSQRKKKDTEQPKSDTPLPAVPHRPTNMVTSNDISFPLPEFKSANRRNCHVAEERLKNRGVESKNDDDDEHKDSTGGQAAASNEAIASEEAQETPMMGPKCEAAQGSMSSNEALLESVSQSTIEGETDYKTPLSRRVVDERVAQPSPKSDPENPTHKHLEGESSNTKSDSPGLALLSLACELKSDDENQQHGVDSASDGERNRNLIPHGDINGAEALRTQDSAKLDSIPKDNGNEDPWKPSSRQTKAAAEMSTGSSPKLNLTETTIESDKNPRHGKLGDDPMAEKEDSELEKTEHGEEAEGNDKPPTDEISVPTSSPIKSPRRRAGRRALITRNFVEDYRDSKPDDPDVLCKLLNSTKRESTRQDDDSVANQIGLVISVNKKERDSDEMSECTNSIASCVVPFSLDEEDAAEPAPTRNEDTPSNEITPGESRRGIRKADRSSERSDCLQKLHDDEEEEEEGDGGVLGTIEHDDLAADVSKRQSSAHTPEKSPHHETSEKASNGKRKGEESRRCAILDDPNASETPLTCDSNSTGGAPSKTPAPQVPSPRKQARSTATTVSCQNESQCYDQNEQTAESWSNGETVPSPSAGEIPESSRKNNKRKAQSDPHEGKNCGSKARLEELCGTRLSCCCCCCRRQGCQCAKQKRSRKSQIETGRHRHSGRGRCGSTCHCCFCEQGVYPANEIGKTPPSPLCDHKRNVTISESKEISSVPLWTSESAGLENISSIFRLADGRQFRHPPLPPGWTIEVSRSRQFPFYSHPDYGRSFYPPILLPSMDRSIQAKTVLVQGQWEIERKDLSQMRSADLSRKSSQSKPANSLNHPSEAESSTRSDGPQSKRRAELGDSVNQGGETQHDVTSLESCSLAHYRQEFFCARSSHKTPMLGEARQESNKNKTPHKTTMLSKEPALDHHMSEIACSEPMNSSPEGSETGDLSSDEIGVFRSSHSGLSNKERTLFKKERDELLDEVGVVRSVARDSSPMNLLLTTTKDGNKTSSFHGKQDSSIKTPSRSPSPEIKQSFTLDDTDSPLPCGDNQDSASKNTPPVSEAPHEKKPGSPEKASSERSSMKTSACSLHEKAQSDRSSMKTPGLQTVAPFSLSGSTKDNLISGDRVKGLRELLVGSHSLGKSEIGSNFILSEQSRGNLMPQSVQQGEQFMKDAIDRWRFEDASEGQSMQKDEQPPDNPTETGVFDDASEGFLELPGEDPEDSRDFSANMNENRPERVPHERHSVDSSSHGELPEDSRYEKENEKDDNLLHTAERIVDSSSEDQPTLECSYTDHHDDQHNVGSTSSWSLPSRHATNPAKPLCALQNVGVLPFVSSVKKKRKTKASKKTRKGRKTYKKSKSHTRHSLENLESYSERKRRKKKSKWRQDIPRSVLVVRDPTPSKNQSPSSVEME